MTTADAKLSGSNGSTLPLASLQYSPTGMACQLSLWRAGITRGYCPPAAKATAEPRSRLRGRHRHSIRLSGDPARSGKGSRAALAFRLACQRHGRAGGAVPRTFDLDLPPRKNRNKPRRLGRLDARRARSHRVAAAGPGRGARRRELQGDGRRRRESRVAVRNVRRFRTDVRRRDARPAATITRSHQY